MPSTQKEGLRSCHRGREEASDFLAEEENSDLDSPAPSQRELSCPAIQGAQGRGRELLDWGFTLMKQTMGPQLHRCTDKTDYLNHSFCNPKGALIFLLTHQEHFLMSLLSQLSFVLFSQNIIILVLIVAWLCDLEQLLSHSELHFLHQQKWEQ